MVRHCGKPSRVSLAREPWSVELGLELGNVPHRSTQERTVGFDGTKVENLHNSPLSLGMFYVPLTVDRDVAGGEHHQSLVNVRAALTYRLW